MDELIRREIKLCIGGSVYDPSDSVGKLLFNALALVAELEIDLIRARIREGMAFAKAKGKLRGKSKGQATWKEAQIRQGAGRSLGFHSRGMNAHDC
ncbi:recombinase family protein [Glutamicibacter ardleyensis]|uniref:recombinase family protein n=1 Tax=Glutamicibacter ardleyensis TaxID=225894 RepID=UPI003FD3F38E